MSKEYSQEQIDALYQASTMLASVQYQLDDMDVQSDLLDRIYVTLQSLERECDEIVRAYEEGRV